MYLHDASVSFNVFFYELMTTSWHYQPACRSFVTLQWQCQGLYLVKHDRDQSHCNYTACQLAQGKHSNPSRLDASTWNILRELGIAARLPTKRGCRGGRKQNRIPTVIGHRPISKHAANEMHTSSQMHDNLITQKSYM